MTAGAVTPAASAGAVTPPALPGSALVSYGGFDFELAPEGAGGDPGAVPALREEVLRLAARARGWTEPEEIAAFGRVFTLQPLYDADALALVWRDGRLVGTAGFVHRLPLEGGAIVHLCAVGFLREAQNRGFMPVLFGLLWDVVTSLPRLAEPYRDGRLYVSAITQSPYLMAFLRHVAELAPTPERPTPDARALEVARTVHGHFDPEIPLDLQTLVLREEARFFYRKVPYSTDREVNEFCDSRLRYAAGDTFLAVGRVRPESIEPLLGIVRTRAPELFDALRDALPPVTGRSA